MVLVIVSPRFLALNLCRYECLEHILIFYFCKIFVAALQNVASFCGILGLCYSGFCKKFLSFSVFHLYLCKHTADDGCLLQSLGSPVTEMDLHFKECWMIYSVDFLSCFSVLFLVHFFCICLTGYFFNNSF